MMFIFVSASSQVLIKPETSQFFLEVHDSLQVYKVRDTLQSKLIHILREEHKIKDQIIETYKSDSVTYNNLLISKKEENKSLTQQIKKEKLKTKGAILLSIIIGVLALL